MTKNGINYFLLCTKKLFFFFKLKVKLAMDFFYKLVLEQRSLSTPDQLHQLYTITYIYLIVYILLNIFVGYGGYVGLSTLGYDFSRHLLPKGSESSRSMRLQLQYDFTPKKWLFLGLFFSTRAVIKIGIFS